MSMTGTPATSRVGNDLERANDLGDVGICVRLHGRDDDVLTAFATATAFVEQLERFSDSRGVPEKDLQATSAFGPFRRLHLPKQCVRVAGRTAVSVSAQRHATILPDTNRAGPSRPGA